MLSLSCKAAIKAVVFLGSKLSSGERVSLKDVSVFIGENEHTVGKLLQRLVKADLICSLKGPRGGFYISPEQADLPVIRIVHTMDGDDVFKQCGLGLSKCSDSHPCPFHDGFKPIREQFRNLCEEYRVRDLYEGVNDGLTYLVG
ncbi:MAG: Rrf2 family transcriptional regulator [Flavobacteriales bacterium]|jgi:Rrf2 family protein|nr:Rrf2 family transcriptional regulator [Flavobacteriales bacterium]MBK6945404.1 Rrf2 family transcriptional regulator [Flavobacteriales bacterium]MBK7241520.1 Rrf2 family transcriptional regulator [Flavobacteriales bacterium]MBK7298349.1 Rrf2 family transcriptional regulator [Flavobacteriales bacterium]MBK9535038.1 Rrf2 family transcriptional regulator [Flavobacteriales bacterium]